MAPAVLIELSPGVLFAQEARIGGKIESDHVVEVVGAGIVCMVLRESRHWGPYRRVGQWS